MINSTKLVVEQITPHRKGATTSTTNEHASPAATVLPDSKSHYELHHSAKSFESAYFYKDAEYMDFVCEASQAALGIIPMTFSYSTSPRTLVDVGGGTGNFTKKLIRNVPRMKAIVVDPYLVMEGQDERNNNVSFVKSCAEDEFGAELGKGHVDHGTNRFDFCVLKEVVHHLSDRRAVFSGIFQRLNPGGRTLIITRPQFVDFPLWSEAREVRAGLLPSQEQVSADLEVAGFTKVHHQVLEYPVRIPLEAWLDMIQKRCWSTFSNFSDGVLKEGCNIIEKNLMMDPKDDIEVSERLIFITGEKNGE